MKITTDEFPSAAACVEYADSLLTPSNIVMGILVLAAMAIALVFFIKWRRRNFRLELLSHLDGVQITQGKFNLRVCPTCSTAYIDPELNFCLHDGSKLDAQVTAQLTNFTGQTFVLPTLPNI
jgi:hypothetical protein